MKMLTRLGYLVEERGVSYLADIDTDSPERPLSGAPTVFFESISNTRPTGGLRP